MANICPDIPFNLFIVKIIATDNAAYVISGIIQSSIFPIYQVNLAITVINEIRLIYIVMTQHKFIIHLNGIIFDMLIETFDFFNQVRKLSF